MCHRRTFYLQWGSYQLWPNQSLSSLLSEISRGKEAFVSASTSTISTHDGEHERIWEENRRCRKVWKEQDRGDPEKAYKRKDTNREDWPGSRMPLWTNMYFYLLHLYSSVLCFKTNPKWKTWKTQQGNLLSPRTWTQGMARITLMTLWKWKIGIVIMQGPWIPSACQARIRSCFAPFGANMGFAENLVTNILTETFLLDVWCLFWILGDMLVSVQALIVNFTVQCSVLHNVKYWTSHRKSLYMQKDLIPIYDLKEKSRWVVIVIGG